MTSSRDVPAWPANPNLLLIGARAPVPGTCKTRLGASIGMAAAATLYGAFLVDLSARFTGDAAPEARNSWPTAIARVHGAQPMLGMNWSCSGLYGTSWVAM